MIDVQSVLQGDRLALSRLLTQIENDTPEGQEVLGKLFSHTGQAHLIGVTGAPGTGKSSLVNKLAYHYRHPKDGVKPTKVAVVAIDPSSPFSGGALLGDRIRMSSLSGDRDVFIRSMASRGSLGGLAHATAGQVQAFDAAGYETIFIETVGAGQAEVDIARLAHTTLVIEAPGLGDDIQAIKAGILEIADILVVNKADRPGVEKTERSLRNMLQLAHPTKRIFRHHGKAMEVEQPEPTIKDEPMWVPPIQKTIATDGTGVVELVEHIANHRAYLEKTGDLGLRERTRLAAELDHRLQTSLVARWQEKTSDGRYEEVLDKLVTRDISFQDAVKQLLNGRKKK